MDMNVYPESVVKDLRSLKMDLFIDEISSTKNTIVFQIYQNETRRTAFNDWGSDQLWRTDRKRFTNDDGTIFMSELEIFKQIEGYQWSDDWKIIINASTDKNGYQYAMRWTLLVKQCKPARVMTFHHLVRRKVMTRTLIKVPPAQQVNPNHKIIPDEIDSLEATITQLVADIGAVTGSDFRKSLTQGIGELAVPASCLQDIEKILDIKRSMIMALTSIQTVESVPVAIWEKCQELQIHMNMLFVANLDQFLSFVASSMCDDQFMREVFFATCETEDALRKQLKRICLILHPDKVSASLRETATKVCQDIRSFSDDCIDQINSIYSLDTGKFKYYVQSGGAAYETALFWNSASKLRGAVDNVSVLSAEDANKHTNRIVKLEERFPQYHLNSLSAMEELRKTAAFQAVSNYRAAIRIADDNPEAFILQRIHLRRSMATVLFVGAEYVSAQLYLCGAVQLACDTLDDPTQEIREIEAIRRTMLSRQEMKSNDPAFSSSSAGTLLLTQHPQQQSVPASSTELVLRDPAKLTALQKKNRLRNASSQDSAQWLLSAIRVDSTMIDSTTDQLKIRQANNNSMASRVSGAVIVGPAAALAGMSIAEVSGVTAVSIVASTMATGGIALLAFAIVGGSILGCFGLYRLLSARNMNAETIKLNQMVKDALDYHSCGQDERVLTTLACDYGKGKKLFLFDKGQFVLLDPNEFISTLLIHGFRADGIAYLLCVIAEVLMSGKVVLTHETEKLRSNAETIFRHIWENDELKENADILDANVQETHSKMFCSSFARVGQFFTTETASSAYRDDAQTAPFRARLDEIINIAKMNSAILHLIKRSHNENESRNTARILLDDVIKATKDNFQYFCVCRNRIEALEDLLRAFGVHSTVDDNPVAVVPEPGALSTQTINRFCWGTQQYQCVNIVSMCATLNVLFGKNRTTSAQKQMLVAELERIREINAQVLSVIAGPTSRPGLAHFDKVFELLSTKGELLCEDWKTEYVPVYTFLYEVTIVLCTADSTNTCYINAVENDAFCLRAEHVNSKCQGIVLESGIPVSSFTFSSMQNGVTSPSTLESALSSFNQATAATRFAKSCAQFETDAMVSWFRASKLFMKSLLETSPHWKLVLSLAKVSFLATSSYGFQKIQDPALTYESSRQEVTCCLGLLECLVHMAKYKRVIRLATILRLQIGFKDNSMFWYWVAKAARKRDLMYDAAVAIQKSLKLEHCNNAAVIENALITSSKLTKITSPPFKWLCEKVQAIVKYPCDGSLSARLGERSYYDIIAIDGGGVRGIIPAYLLDVIESRAQLPICSLSQMLAGTSTGAIIAAALCVPRPNNYGRPLRAHSLTELYANPDRCAKMFTPYSLSRFSMLTAKYSAVGRQQIVNEYMTDFKFSSRALCNELLVTAVDDTLNIATNSFNTFEARSKGDIYDCLISDAVMASSAAPTFFPCHPIGGSSFVDGGMQANNPAHLAYIAAKDERKENIRVWSLGTGDCIPSSGNLSDNRGSLYWLGNAHVSAMAAQHGTVDKALSSLLGQNYSRWQVWLDKPTAMDDYSEPTLTMLLESAKQFVEDADASDDNFINKCVEALVANCNA